MAVGINALVNGALHSPRSSVYGVFGDYTSTVLYSGRALVFLEACRVTAAGHRLFHHVVPDLGCSPMDR
jgi:hypothetical protein